MFMKRVKVRAHERVLLSYDGEYRRLLKPGIHWIFGLPWKVEARAFDTAVAHVSLAEAKLDVVIRDPAFWQEVQVIDVKAHERAIVWLDGRPRHYLLPGKHAFWKGLHEVTFAVLDARDVRVEDEAARTALLSVGVAAQNAEVEDLVVAQESRALLFVDGGLKEVLGPGRYALLKGVRRVQAQVIDLREQAVEVGGQELLTADKVSIRVNLVATYRVVDPVKTVFRSQDIRAAAYRELQLALREEVGGKTLEELLAAKAALGTTIRERIAPSLASAGLEVGPVGVKDVILPGEMRTILARVVEAEKQALANNILRREETAATRSLLNTAKLMEQNPILLRLKEIEALERVAAKVGSITVLGGVDHLLRDLLPAVRAAGFAPPAAVPEATRGASGSA